MDLSKWTQHDPTLTHNHKFTQTHTHWGWHAGNPRTKAKGTSRWAHEPILQHSKTHTQTQIHTHIHTHGRACRLSKDKGYGVRVVLRLADIIMGSSLDPADAASVDGISSAR